jgi:hypothetical protein
MCFDLCGYRAKARRSRMDKKIEEARREFNAVLDYVAKGALGREIHEVEAGIYQRLLLLGRFPWSYSFWPLGQETPGRS